MGNNAIVLSGDATVNGDFEYIKVTKGTLHFSGSVQVLEICRDGSAFVQDGSNVGKYKLHEGGAYTYGDCETITGWC